MTEEEVVSESKGQDENGSNKGEETALESAIIRQVEYYFGDANLPRDKFLREQVKLDEGWVPIDVLIRFNRLAKLTTDVEAIAAALHKSSAGLVEVSEDCKRVRRNPELAVPEMNEEHRKELQARTVYVKGFGKEAELDDILGYLKEHGEVDNVIMRRYQDNKTKQRCFKGSVFATFKTLEEAQKFIGTTGLKYKETELIVRWQEEYLQEKQEEYAARKEKKEKKHKVHEQDNTKSEELKLPTGTVLHFSEGSDTMTREHIKEALAPLGGEVAFVDFKVGDKEGWVRLGKQDAAKEVFLKLGEGGRLRVAGAEVQFRLVAGEEEGGYLARSADEMTKRRRTMKNNKQNRGSRSFKGKQHGRKRKQDRHEDAPTPKVKAE